MIKVYLSRCILLICGLAWVAMAGAQQTVGTGNQKSTNIKDSDTVKNFSSDTKTTMLNEVVVESASRKRIPQGVAFFPSKREKSLATDAVSLIEMMALTELPYDYRANTVTTPSGGAVTYFIDGREATPSDLKALNPKDVDRIEYFPLPTSGDFIGKRDVVNYVMKKYLSGGFTRINAQQYLDGSSGDYSVSSRIVYKEVTLDGYFDGAYTNTDKSGSLTKNIFKDFTYNSAHYDDVRETVDGRHRRTRQNDMGAFFKTTWSHRAVDLVGVIGWNWVELPNVDNRLATTYSPEILNSSFALTQNSSLRINPYVVLSTQFKLPNNQSIIVQFQEKYLADRSSSHYTPHNLSTIYNANKGKNWWTVGKIGYDKSFNSRNSLGISAAVAARTDNIDYVGSYDGKNKFNSLFNTFTATFSHTFSKKTNFSISGGIEHDLQRINGTKTSIWSPDIYAVVNHDWNDISNIQVSSSLFGSSYPGRMLNDVTLRVSELLWRKGNPDLKNRVWWQSNIVNTWNFSRKLSLTLNGLYTHIYNKDFQVWDTRPDMDGVISSFSDNGDVDWWRAGAKITFKPFNRRLVLTGSFDYDFYKFSGIYHKRKGYVKGSASAMWYGKQWYTSFSLVPGTLEAYDNTNVELYYNWQYRIQFGYNFKNVNLYARIQNPFGKNLSSIRRVDTQHFSQRIRNYSYRSANAVMFVVTYTLSYGKKVSKPYMQITESLDSGALTVD